MIWLLRHRLRKGNCRISKIYDVNSLKNDSENIEIFKGAAKDCINEQNKKITLRISEDDLSRIKILLPRKAFDIKHLLKAFRINT